MYRFETKHDIFKSKTIYKHLEILTTRFKVTKCFMKFKIIQVVYHFPKIAKCVTHLIFYQNSIQPSLKVSNPSPKTKQTI